MLTTPQVATAIREAYSSVLFHPIGDASLSVLQQLYDTAYIRFTHSRVKTCEITCDNEHNNPSTAAMIVVANAILNLDEVITKN